LIESRSLAVGERIVGETERPGGLEVDDQLDLGGLLDGQLGGLFAFKYPADVDADQTEIFRFVASVAHQTAGSGEASILEDRGHRVTHSQSSELFAADGEEWTGADDECVCPSLDQGCKDRGSRPFRTSAPAGTLPRGPLQVSPDSYQSPYAASAFGCRHVYRWGLGVWFWTWLPLGV
jgi:hypothetical protein